MRQQYFTKPELVYFEFGRCPFCGLSRSHLGFYSILCQRIGLKVRTICDLPASVAKAREGVLFLCPRDSAAIAQGVYSPRFLYGHVVQRHWRKVRTLFLCLRGSAA